MMRRGTAIQIYKSMPAAEQQVYRQWARGNVALFTMLAGVLATSLVVAPSAPSLPQVAANSLTLTE